MSKKYFTLIVVVVLAGLLLSACQLRASRAPEPTAAPTDDFPFPIGEGQQVDIIGEVQTQTASVGGGAPPPEQAQETPEPAEAPQAEAPDVNEEEQAGGGVQQPEAPAQPAAPVAVPTVTRPSSYTLQKGEFPYCIARRFDVPAGALLSLNNLGPNSRVSPGLTLQIPQSGSWEGGGRALKPHPATHTVTAGETIYTIACTFGDVTPEAIIAVNGLQAPYTLSVGQTLQIP
jgi:LysM repeat protein